MVVVMITDEGVMVVIMIDDGVVMLVMMYRYQQPPKNLFMKFF